MIQSLFVGNKVCVPWMELITERSYFTLWTVSIEVNLAICPKINVFCRWNSVISPTVSMSNGLQSVNEAVSQIIDHILMHTIAIFPKRKTKMCHRETKILCSFFSSWANVLLCSISSYQIERSLTCLGCSSGETAKIQDSLQIRA